jgi:hypothetical protein
MYISFKNVNKCKNLFFVAVQEFWTVVCYQCGIHMDIDEDETTSVTALELHKRISPNCPMMICSFNVQPRQFRTTPRWVEPDFSNLGKYCTII